MDIRRFNVLILAVFSLLVVTALSFFSNAFAAEYRTILLTNNAALTEVAEQKLGTELNIMPTGIDVDYKSRKFTTDEGTRVLFSRLFHNKSLKGSKVLKTFADQYTADTLALLWISYQSREPYNAYGLRKDKMTIRLRIVDITSGKDVFQMPARFTSDFGPGLKKRALIKKTIAKVEVERLITRLDRFYKPKGPGKIKIVIRNIDQDEYFNKRYNFLALAINAGVKSDVRETYEKGIQTLTLRGVLLAGKSVDTYYRSLYAGAVTNEIFDNFDIDQKGMTTLITKLPPDRRRFVISGLTPDRYHDRLKIYRDALSGLPGVKDIDFQYIARSGELESRLVFSFTYKEDLPALEEKIWDRLAAAGYAPNRELVSISQKIIHIKSAFKPGDRVTVTVHFNNVSPGDFRKIGTPLDRIIKSLDIRNLTKAYDRDLYRLTYTLDMNKPPVNLDTTLWRKIEADSSLEKIVQDTTYGTTLAYFYHHNPLKTMRIKMSIKNLSPQNYKREGRRITAIVKAISGVTRMDKSYSEYDQTLTLTFMYKGENAYPIDDTIWQAVRRDRSLRKLALGHISESELVYFFGGQPPVTGQVALFLKQVSGQDYKTVSTSFADLLGGIKNVRDVRYNYVFSLRTVAFHLAYEGKSLFDLEDALQRKMVRRERFKYVAKGPSRANTLVYFFYTKPVAVIPDTDESPSFPAVTPGQERVSDDLALLHRSVVVVLAYTAAGPARGTGFIVSQSGYVMTGAKNTAGQKLVVRLFDGTQLQAQKVKTSDELNLAVLKLIAPQKTFESVQIGNSNRLNMGDKVVMIGAQQGQDYGHRTETGTITGLHLPKDMMQLSFPAAKARAGAPVFDIGGRVVGVMSGSGYPQGEHRSLAVPINHARALLEVIQ